MAQILKTLLAATPALLLGLTACGDATEVKSGTVEKTETSKSMTKPEAKASASLATKGKTAIESGDVGQMLDYLGEESQAMITTLERVTDESSAEAAVASIRSAIPRLNAALETLQNQDISSMKANMAMLRKMPALAKDQAKLLQEIQRISDIPEARAVLEKEFDKIEIFGPGSNDMPDVEIGE